MSEARTHREQMAIRLLILAMSEAASGRIDSAIVLHRRACLLDPTIRPLLPCPACGGDGCDGCERTGIDL